MTEQEVEMALASLFIGAERVRAKKHARTFSKNFHRECSERILNQMWEREKQNLKTA